MIKNKTVIEYNVGERKYEFFCSSDSPLGELHDALCFFKSLVIEKITEVQKKENARDESVPEKE